jgi:hypothetical protein
MSPTPSTAVPSETTATVFPLMVNDPARSRSRGSPCRRARRPRVRHREIVARLDRELAHRQQPHVAIVDLLIGEEPGLSLCAACAAPPPARS